MSSSLPGKDTKIYAAIASAATMLVRGDVLVIDPSVGSHSSMPGWSYWQSGELITSGTLSIDPNEEKWVRLKQVSAALRQLSKQFPCDVCVYEDVPVSAHAGRSQVAHATLLMAVGVTMASVDARLFVGMPPVVWKKRVNADYVKSDEADALEIGRIVIEMATEILQKVGKK